MRLRSSVIIVLMFLLCLPASGAAYGATSFWSPLTPFEIKVLRNAEAARQGEPNTLLALALMASGDVRDQAAYDRARTRVLQFVERIRPDIEHQTSIYAKGEKLLHGMHTHFLAGGKNGTGAELLSGYDSAQSKVSAILTTGKFNCISSAILYMILARYFDLDIQGVVTTQHAFVQIQGDDGRSIEVETTSKSGYGMVHDKAFYNKRFTAFSISRNLAVPVYEDYLHRRVVPPFRLIAENMNNQHTTAARMNAATRQRLYETMGYLDPESAKAQLIRLNALYNAGVDQLHHRDKQEIDRMFTVLEPLLQQVKERQWIYRKDEKTVADILNRLADTHMLLGHLNTARKDFDGAEYHYAEALQWSQTKAQRKQSRQGLYKSRAYGAFRSQQWETAIEAYQNLLPMIESSDQKMVRQTKENIAAAYWNWGNTAGGSKDWMNAAARYESIAKWSRDPQTLKKAKTASSKANALYHFERQDWAQAIHFFKEEMSQQDRRNAAISRSNIGTAYINWGNAFFNTQDYQQALTKYEAALKEFPADKQTRLYNNIAAAYHNMTVPLLEQNQIAQAADILASGVKRFPNCAPCRQEEMQLRQLDRQQKAQKRQ